MPPRYAYWTIILEGKPTAFRALSDAELLPTFKQLQARHPDVVMKWFSRGRLWNSPEEERAALTARRRERPEHRGRDWRPGGSHQDPRARFDVPRGEKRRRFAERMRRDRRQEQGEGPPRAGGKPGSPPWRSRPDRRARGPRDGQPSSSGPGPRTGGGQGQGSRGHRGGAGRPDRRGPGAPGGSAGTSDRGPGTRGQKNRWPGNRGTGGPGTGGRTPRGGGPGVRKGPRGPGGGRGGGGHGR